MDENIFSSSDAILSKRTLAAILVISLVTVGIISVSVASADGVDPETRRPIAWESLVARWNFNDDSSADVWDVSTELTGIHNGTNHGANYTYPSPISLTGQEESYALDFDGTDDYVEVAHSDSLNISDEITISLWVKWRDDGIRDDYLLAKRKGRNSNYQLRIDGDPYGQIEWDWDGVLKGQISKEDTWTHLVVTGNSSTKKIYVNGKLNASDTGSYFPSPIDAPLWIGRPDPNTYSRYAWNGTIDEVRIYNRVLSEDNIESIYNRTRPK